MDGREGVPSGTIHYPVVVLLKITPRLGIKKSYIWKNGARNAFNWDKDKNH